MIFSNKIALVTGASRGIGKAIAIHLARHGATVLGTATSEQGAHLITDYLKTENLMGRGYTLDVSKPESIDQLFKSIQSDFAGPSILVNNAAITRDNLMLRMKEEEWESVINTNLTSVYRLTKLCLKDMLKARWGRIINITSVVGFTGNPGQANYAAAKAGLVGFSKSLAQEVASRDITVNLVAPGFIDTDMTRALSDAQREMLLTKIPANRLGTVDDVAAAVKYLASEEASYMTGQTLHVNGGMFMG